MTQFDRAAAERVPPFPRLVLELTEDGRAFVRDQAVEIPTGMDAQAAALAVVASYVRERSIGAVRVLVRDGDGHEWPMVVNEDGQHVDLSNQPGKKSAARGWLLPASVTAATLLVVAAVVATVLAGRQNGTEPTTVSSVRPSAQPTEYPVLAPDGWTTRARWATGPLASDAAPLRLGGTLIGVLTDDGRLEVLDVASGNVKWSAKAPRSITSGPALTTINGQQVIALATQSEIQWWPATGAKDAAKLKLPDGTQEVSWAGTAPLAIRPDQHASVLDGLAWSDRIVPAGSKPLAADGKRFIAADLAGRWWSIDTDAQVAPAPRNVKPPQPGSALTGIAGYLNGQLASTWTTTAGQSLVALSNLTTNTTRSVPTGPAAQEPKFTQAGDFVAIDRVAIADTRSGVLRALPQNWSTDAVLADRIYGRIGDERRLMKITGPALRITSKTVPAAVIGATALSFATVDQKPVLFALTAASAAQQPKPIPAS